MFCNCWLVGECVFTLLFTSTVSLKLVNYRFDIWYVLRTFKVGGLSAANFDDATEHALPFPFAICINKLLNFIS